MWDTVLLSQQQTLDLTAIGAVATAIATGGLLVAAIIAGRKLGSQLEVATQMREDALLPYVSLHLPTNTAPGPDFNVELENGGPGPALNVIAYLWIFARQTPVTGEDAWTVVTREQGSRDGWGEPHFTTAASIVSSGSTTRPRAIPHAVLSDNWRGPNGHFTAWAIDYENVSGRRPSHTPVQGAAFSPAS